MKASSFGTVHCFCENQWFALNNYACQEDCSEQHWSQYDVSCIYWHKRGKYTTNSACFHLRAVKLLGRTQPFLAWRWKKSLIGSWYSDQMRSNWNAPENEETVWNVYWHNEMEYHYSFTLLFVILFYFVLC